MSFQKTAKAISDPTRREILNLLKAGPMTAGDIGEHFKTTGATMSHHLSILKEAELITDERKGKYIYYELNMTVLDEILNWMTSLRG
ncbi:MAG: winged helix-turn-helix transcriptional regulator [Peptostreptococcaceae bacterium]|nr:winged helix-turn-helix transcriptional regulator [Peptostreptococcaceae bacterium]